jgi:2-polyprenyl-3-methyl-5-hydroxy-6-metoxy-1,4-benzoquinol methylase
MTSSSLQQVECLLCHGSMVPWMVIPCDWRRPDHPAMYPIYFCRTCHFGQVHPRPDRDQIPSFYRIESYYTHDNGSAHSGRGSLTLLDRLRIKFAWLNDHGVEIDDYWLQKHFSPRARVCDLGCGKGDLLTRLSRLGHEVIGVEPDTTAGEIARGKGHRILPGTAEELPAEIRNERYDCIVMSHVLEHCLDPKLAVSNATELLAERGLLIIETPNNEAKGLKQAGVLWPWLDAPRHLNFFTSQSLQSICEASGLSVKDVEYSGYTRQFNPEWIGMERRIRDVFSARVSRLSELPSPNRGSNSWRLLFSTARSSSRLKYDSVRVIAGRPAEGERDANDSTGTRRST